MKTFQKLFKIALMGVLTLFIGNSIAQTKFTSLDDACTRRTSETSKTAYVPNFSVGQYAFVNNSYRNFRRITKGFYYHPTSNSAFQVGLRGNITAIQTCVNQIPGSLQIQNQFAKGLTGDSSYELDPGGSFWYYPPNGDYWSQMSVTYNENTGKLNVTTNINGWEGDTPVKFKVEISPKWLTETELEAIDFSNQKGQDVFILGQRWFANGSPAYCQASFVHIKGDANSNVPSFYVRQPTKRMPQFVYNFPNFSLSSTKVNALFFNQLDDSFNNVSSQYLNKGFSIAAQSSNQAQTFIGEYDHWAYDNGCPRGNQAGAIAWLENTPIQQLYNYFYHAIIAPGHYKGMVFLDFEAWGTGVVASQNIANKLGTLFRAFKQHNPNTIFTNYLNAKPCSSRYGNNINATDMALENDKYNKSYNQIVTGFFANTCYYLDVNTGLPDGTSGKIGDNITPTVGDYLLYVNKDQLYSTIQEIELTRKHLPNSKMLSLNWGTNENVEGSDWNTARKFFKKQNGFTFSKLVKLPIPCSYAYNMSMWSNFLGDGAWWWEDPLPFMEGYEYVGTLARKADDSEYLPNEFSPNFGMMHYNAQIPYDYVARALYELHFNNDILDANTAAFAPEYSTDGGINYYSGDDLKPASAEFKKLPIVRARKHPTLNQWLICAVNHNLDHYQNQTIKVRIAGKTVDITLNGQFSSLKRVSLI